MFWKIAFLILAAVSGYAHADDIKPGLWKISLESSVATSPGWKPQPFENTQCLTEQDAQNPAPLLMGSGSSQVSGCDFPTKQQGSGTFSFELSCQGALGLKGQGEVNYSATQFDGYLNVSFGDVVSNQTTQMQNKIHGTYLGPCTGQ